MTGFRAVRGAIGWRASQQAGIQLIYFARLLILARLLAPEAFGLLAISMLALTVLLSLSDLGVVPALVQRTHARRDEQDAAWTIGLIRALGIVAVLVVAAPVIAALFGDPRATPIIRVLAMRAVLEALGSIGIVRLTRDFRFRELAMIHVPAALLDAGVAISLASSMGVWALVAGTLVGTASATALSYVLAPHRPRLVFNLAAAAPLVRYGRWMLGTSVLGLAGSSAVQLVISRRLGVAELGLYFLATKIAFLPADAASTVLGSVGFPLYASLQDDERSTTATLRSMMTVLALVLFPVYVLMIVLAPSLAEALGSRWAGTAPLIQIVGIAALGGVYADSALPLLLGLGRPHHAMAVSGIQTAVLLLALVPLTHVFGVVGAAAAWLPAYAAAQVGSYFFVRQAIRHPLAGAGRALLALLTIALVGGAVAALARVWFDGLVALIGGIMLGLGSAVFLLRLASRHMDFGLWDLFGPRAVVASP